MLKKREREKKYRKFEKQRKKKKPIFKWVIIRLMIEFSKEVPVCGVYSLMFYYISFRNSFLSINLGYHIVLSNRYFFYQQDDLDL